MKRKKYKKSLKDKIVEFFTCIGLGAIVGVLLTVVSILLYTIIQSV